MNVNLSNSDWGEAHAFWLSFLRDVFDIPEPETFKSNRKALPSASKYQKFD